MYVTYHGLVLREVKYKESSKILTILTEEAGKITAEAKGVLRKGSKCAASAQILTWSELTFFENQGRYTLTEGSVLRDFEGLRSDFGDYALACYFAELTESLSDEDSPNVALLRLTLNALYALSEKQYASEHIKAVFELRLMCLAGFTPNLQYCSVCGKDDIQNPYFSLYGGGIHCPGCTPDCNGKSLLLCSDSLMAMRYVCTAEANKIYAFRLEEKAAERFYRICEEYVPAQLDRKFSALDYWKGVKGL